MVIDSYLANQKGMPMQAWLKGLIFLMFAMAGSAQSMAHENDTIYRMKQGFPTSDLSWTGKWKGLTVERTSPTSFRVRFVGHHGSTGAVTKDHIFEVEFHGLSRDELHSGQTFKVSLSGRARIVKKYGYNPNASFKLSWNLGLELVDVQSRIPKRPLKDSAVIGPSLKEPTDSREMTFRVRPNQREIRLSLVLGGHGELIRFEWERTEEVVRPVTADCCRPRPEFPISDLSWTSKWKGLTVEETSPTSFRVRFVGHHGSTGELTKDHIFDVQFHGIPNGELCPDQIFSVTLNGLARVIKKYGYNPKASFKLSWSLGLELLNVQPRIPKRPLKDSAVVGPSLKAPTDYREITFRVRPNQTELRLSLVLGGHGEMMRWEWSK